MAADGAAMIAECKVVKFPAFSSLECCIWEEAAHTRQLFSLAAVERNRRCLSGPILWKESLAGEGRTS